jgi:tRNA dimethylallyltransferase
LTSYNKINRNDSQRIQRAIEVYLTTGKPISSFFDNKKNFLDAYDVITIQMHSKERLFVHERIESRTREMFQKGLIEEVEFVSRKYNLTLESKSMKIIGYKHVLEFLENSGNFEDLVNQCIFATRQLAKRQITWLKQFPSDIEVDIKNFDPNIIYRLVDSHCNLSK